MMTNMRKPMARPTRPMTTGRPNPAGGMSRGFPANGQQIGGAGADASGRFPDPRGGGGIDGAIQGQMNQFLTGGMAQPRGMALPPGRLQKMNAPPAWQQLQAMGMGGQGSAAANKAMLGQVNGVLGVPQGGYNPAGGGAPRMPGVAPNEPQGGAIAAPYPGGGPGNPMSQAMQSAGAGPGMQPQPRPFPMQQTMDQLTGGGGGQEPFAQAMTSPGGGAAPAVHQDLLQKVFRGGMGGGGMNGGMR